MNSKCLRAVLFLVPTLLIPAGSAGQTNKPPELKPPPERAAWTVRYKDEKEAQKPAEASDDMLADPAGDAPQIRKIEYAINGKVGRRVTYYSNRTTKTAFVLDSLGVQEHSQDPKYLVINDLTLPWMAREDFRRRYPGLEWVKPQFYRGVVTLDEISCHHFVEPPPPQPPPPSEGAENEMLVSDVEIWTGGRMAWIGLDGRPLAAKEGTITSTFVFKPADEVPVIEIPERFRAKVLRYLESLSPQNLQ